MTAGQALVPRPAAPLEIIDPGSRTTIQDLGRPGYAHLGVPHSGATDRAAFTLANRLVGNAEDAAALETTIRGPEVKVLVPLTIALTGAEVDAMLDGRSLSMHAPIHVRAGQVLRIGAAKTGLRTYLAVRGGIKAPLTFGSASSDQLTGLGPPPLKAGDRLAVGSEALDAPTVDIAPVKRPSAEPVLRVVLGPREDWFAPDAITALLRAPFSVTPQVDRIGARLRGPELILRTADELRSEGMVAGALQVPPSGEPILLLADHPTTGGYPVIAVVVDEDLPIAAQLRPGNSVRFVRVG
jgi:biotin-dependent carboxylase-like uncharacterized protein